MAGTSGGRPPERKGGAALRVFLLVLTLLLTFGLLSMGTRGDEIASVLALATAIVTLIVVAAPHGVGRPRRAGGPADRASRWWRHASPAVRVVNVAGAVLVGAGVGWLAFYLYLGPPVQFAYQTDVENPALGNGETALVRFAGDTPKRDTLGLALVVEDVRGTGDCVRSTTLELTPIVDGARGEVVRATSGEETRMDVRDERAQLLVEVRPTTDDGCVVRLRVAEALFYG